MSDLVEVYKSLASGTLSKEQAMEKLRLLNDLSAKKEIPAQSRLGLIVGQSSWEIVNNEQELSKRDKAQYAVRYVYQVGCDIAEHIDNQIDARVESLNLAEQWNGEEFGAAYSNLALKILQDVQSIASGKDKTKKLIQVFVSSHESYSVFEGITGLLKTIEIEYPNVHTHMCFVEKDVSNATLSEFLNSRSEGDSGSIYKVSDKGIEEKKWYLKEGFDLKNSTPENCYLKENGVYLISGGLGGVGAVIANSILNSTDQAKVILIGRSNNKNASGKVKDLYGKTSRVEYKQLDVTKADDVKATVADLSAKFGKINGVFHCAGVIEDKLIFNKEPKDFRRVTDPKVNGTLNLDEATKHIQLDFFAMFSSIAAWMGNTGQCDYACANGFMDHFASLRNQFVSTGERYGKTLSVDWPLWESGGMHLSKENIESEAAKSGMYPMPTSIGLEVIESALLLYKGQLLVLWGEKEKLLGLSEKPAVNAKPIVNENSMEKTIVKAIGTSKQDSRKPSKPGDSANVGVEDVATYIGNLVSTILKISPSKLKHDEALETYGIDSIMAMSLTNKLEEIFGSLPKTLFFEYQNITELSEYFLESHKAVVDSLLKPDFSAQEPQDQELTQSQTVAKGVTKANTVTTSISSKRRGAVRLSGRKTNKVVGQNSSQHNIEEPIAIVGLSGRYPQSRDVSEFWNNLLDGKDCITEIPVERWDWKQHYTEDKTQPGHYSKWGGFIEGVDEFDPRFFSISPKEAESIDPQERLFLQHAWMALEDSGHTRNSLRVQREDQLPGKVGVYVGVMYGEYSISGTLASIANRVSYFLNLHGPSLTLDTMCSSSLTAIHLASTDLVLGRTDFAIAGGVNVSIHPNKYFMLSQEQFISTDGHCQSFGEGGDGYIPGEGVGAVLLRRLSDAERDGDQIYGVIRASAVNHGGKTNGYTVPNPKAQSDVIKEAIKRAGISPEQVGYIEAHGTGTKLGDPIEIAALEKAFKQAYGSDYQCWIGSAKSNIGHCESAAGIAGLTKVLMQLKHKKIVPSLHSKKLNPNIDFDNSVFEVVQEVNQWAAPVVGGVTKPRTAGVSSFGAGGSNAHLIIEEYDRAAVQKAETSIDKSTSDEAYAFPVSARTKKQLIQKLTDLTEFLKLDALDAKLESIAYTLQHGRESMRIRTGFWADSKASLLTQIENAIASSLQSENTSTIVDTESEQDLALYSQIKSENTPLDKWITGGTVNWTEFSAESKPLKTSLPSYPFAKEKYWLDPVKVDAISIENKHHDSFVSENLSDIYGLKFRSAQKALEDFYPVNHFSSDAQTIARSELFLPFGAYLDIVKSVKEAAGYDESIDNKSNRAGILFKNVQWSTDCLGVSEQDLDTLLLPEKQTEMQVEIHRADTKDVCFQATVGQVDTNLSKSLASSIFAIEKYKTLDLEGETVFSHESFGKTLIQSVKYDSNKLVATLTSERKDDKGENNKSFIWTSTFTVLAKILSHLSGHTRFFIDSMEQAIQSLETAQVKTIVATFSQESDGIRLNDVQCLDEHDALCLNIAGLRMLPYQVGNPQVDEGEAYEDEMQLEDIPAPSISRSVTNITLSEEQVFYRSMGHSNTSPAGLDKKLVTLQSMDDLEGDWQDRDNSRRHVQLLSPVSTEFSSDEGFVNVTYRSDGVLTLSCSDQLKSCVGTVEVLPALCEALNKATEYDHAKVLCLSPEIVAYFDDTTDDINAVLSSQLLSKLSAIDIPVVASVSDRCVGGAVLMAACCEFILCESKAQVGMSANTIFDSTSDNKEEIALAKFLETRFGRAYPVLLSGLADGESLVSKGLMTQRNGGTTDQIVRALVDKRVDALVTLKRHLSSDLRKCIDELGTIATSHLTATPEAKETQGSELEASLLESFLPELTLTTANKDEVNVGLFLSENKSISEVVNKLADLLKALENTTINRVSIDLSALADVTTFEGLSIDALQKLIKVASDSPLYIRQNIVAGASNIVWALSLFADDTLYGKSSSYFVDLSVLSASEAAFVIAAFKTKFSFAANEILLSNKGLDGAKLSERLGGHVMLGDQADASLTNCRVSKRYENSVLEALFDEYQRISVELVEGKSLDLPQLDVVELVKHDQAVLEIVMADKSSKNMFTDALVKDMTAAFDYVGQSKIKVVVLTGFDNYFASGGTKDALKEIYRGESKFTDTRLFEMPMTCKVPVITAMQGHAIGAGWTLGLFSDLQLFSEESQYLSPYMNYGFTPGAGATKIIAEKIGVNTANRTLYTAQELSGTNIAALNPSVVCSKRVETLEKALQMAKEVSALPLETLVHAKACLNLELRKVMEDVYRAELLMHEKTFVNQEDVLSRIDEQYGAQEEKNESLNENIERANTVKLASAKKPSKNSKFSKTSIANQLRRSLAAELRLEESEISDKEQFIDLGLDSITGVTWVRKINDEYGLSIEATKVYTFTNIKQLTDHVYDSVGGSEEIESVQDSPTINSPSKKVKANKATNTSARILKVLIKFLAEELRLEESEISKKEQFVDIGLDSITGVTWVRKINEEYGLSIEATKIYSYSNVESLAEYVLSQVGGEQVGEPEAAEEVIEQGSIENNSEPSVLFIENNENISRDITTKKLKPLRHKASKDSLIGLKSTSSEIAIIGMDGRFPKSKDLGEFWNNIESGNTCIEEIPNSRWNMDELYVDGDAVPGKTNSKWMGMLDGYDEFDPLFFNISPKEAKSMDPQQRVFMQSCWNAIEHAGYSASDLSGKKCGVFVGCATSDYHLLSKEQQESAAGFTGEATSILAARVSYFLNLQGPCLSIDTACSSSLVALSSACESLILGASDMALAGGVYIMTGPAMLIKTTQSGMLSRDGRCYTFDQRANGFVPGEGVGVVVLKRLEDAIADKDNIQAVIKGWGVNQDGKTNGITAPNADSQRKLLQDVYERFDINPENIQLIEAHGTGTKLGDPIEIDGLKSAFAKFTDEDKFCAIGSVKSNIGHCLTAAGISGVIKLVLSLKHQKIPPTANYVSTNEHIQLDQTPFYVSEVAKEWEKPDASERCAAVSSFGFSGTNAHIVLEGYEKQNPAVQYDTLASSTLGSSILTLSARTVSQLKDRARQLAQHLQSIDENIDIAKLAYTLQLGREAMDERIALVIDDDTNIVQLLSEVADSQDGFVSLDADQVFYGNINQNKENIRLLVNDDELRETVLKKYIDDNNSYKLAELWAKGLEVDWKVVYGNQLHYRAELPGYPFEKKRYWLLEESSTSSVGTTSAIHPLLHKNISTLSKIAYTSDYRSNEVFLGPENNSNKTYSSANVLEFAIAAINNAFDNALHDGSLVLKDIKFSGPTDIDKNTKLFIELQEQGRDAINFEVYAKRNEEQEFVLSQGHAQLIASHEENEREVDLASLRSKDAKKLPQQFKYLSSFKTEERKALVALDKNKVKKASTLSELWHELLSLMENQFAVDAEALYHLRDVDQVSVVNATCDQLSYAIVVFDSSMTFISELKLLDEDGKSQIAWLGANFAYEVDQDKPKQLPSVNTETVSSAPVTKESIESKAPSDIAENPVIESKVNGYDRPVSVMLTHKPAEQGQYRNNLSSEIKPHSITLSPLSDIDLSGLSFSKPSVQLARLLDSQIRSKYERLFVFLYSHGDGIFSVVIKDSASENTLSAELIQQFVDAIVQVSSLEDAKVLIVKGLDKSFLIEDPVTCDQPLIQKALSTLANVKIPVISVMTGDASGAGLLMGMLGDIVILNQDSNYGFAQESMLAGYEKWDIVNKKYPGIGDHLFLTPGQFSGEELKDLGITANVLASSDIDNYVKEIAIKLANIDAQASLLLKGHLTSEISQLVAKIGKHEPELQAKRTDDEIVVDDEFKTCVMDISEDGVPTIIFDIDGAKYGIDVWLRDLKGALASCADQKVVVIKSEGLEFLPNFEDLDLSTITALFDIISQPLPATIVAMQNTCNPLSLLFSLLCDACIVEAESQYQFADCNGNSALVMSLAIATQEVIGLCNGHDLLYSDTGVWTEDSVKNKARFKVVNKDSYQEELLKLCRNLSKRNRTELQSWSQWNASNIQEKIQNIRLPEVVSDAASEVQNKADLKLNSKVISLDIDESGVALVRMEDREAKNMFSDEYLDGMHEAFELIGSNKAIKAVVLVGYDTYFSCGGTREGLIAIQEGKYQFTEKKVFELPLKCEIPVVAAMQGHAIGAGWALGMYADFSVMSEESRYVSPYMGYGFTPGAGATYILPKKLGMGLGNETLMSSIEYSGKALLKRNLPIAVMPRSQVLENAMDIAKKLTRFSRETLVNFKKTWITGYADSLKETYEQELAMHEKTFVGSATTRTYIQSLFNDGQDTQERKENTSVSDKSLASEIPRAKATAPIETKAAEKTVESEDVDNIIRVLLSEEVQIPPEELGEDTSFTKIGVDSIIGVSWVGKINKQFSLDLQATVIYSYPTLIELTDYIRSLLPEEDTSSIQTDSEAISSEELDLSEGSENAVDTISSEAQYETDSVDQAVILEDLAQVLAEELQMQAEEIGHDVPFTKLGVDSIIGVSWVGKVNNTYNTDLQATAIYSFSNLEEFSAHLIELMPKTVSVAKPAEVSHFPQVKKQISVPSSENRLARESRAATLSGYHSLVSWRKTTAVRTSRHIEKIAVIGMAGQFPKSNTLDEFWQNLAGGKDCISVVPEKRWSLLDHYHEGNAVPDKTNCKWIGALDEYDLFDPLFFNIAPVEAEDMDPQQRIFLQNCWHAIENAAYDPSALSGAKCGVFVGCGTGDYHTHAQGMGGSVSILAARISYFLNLQGPCLSIDTACSSSLVAIANACDSLNNGASDIALAGGVCVLSGPSMHIGTTQSGMLSTDGRCFTFDQRANGFVPGEGAGVVVLKRLSDAERDNDNIIATIDGWGVNQDGKTNGITAPNPLSQTRLQQDVYDRFNIDPENIQMIEAHGTGTKLGDPIEIEGISTSFKNYTKKIDYCALGSVKSNIGHTLFAAGIAGFTKVLLSLQHKLIPPTINYERTNEHIRLDNTPFFINDTLRPWERNGADKRSAAVSSFGYSGTNSHIVLSEYDQNIKKPSYTSGQSIVVPLSALTDDRLLQLAKNLHQYIAENKESLLLQDVAYTLQAGRKHFPVRRVIIASSLEELQQLLNEIITSSRGGDSVYVTGEAPAELLTLAQRWQAGAKEDWDSLYSSKPRKVVLPGYPFAKERYWRDPVSPSPSLAPAKSTASTSGGDIEKIINQIDLEQIDTEEGVALLKSI